MTIARFKATAVVLVPITPAQAPNGSVFLDSTNANALTTKSPGGVLTPNLGGTPENIFIKQMEASGAISAKVPVAKLPTGKIVAADSDAAGGQEVIGFALSATLADGDLVMVVLVGANLEGALTGLGYAPGDEIFLSETGGYTNDPNSFTGNDDSIIRVGIADCAAGVASATVVDLIAFAEVIARP